MEKKQFYEAFYQALEKEAQAVGAGLKWMDVLKNNEVLKGIRIQFKKGAAAPVIYPGRYIEEAEDGLPVEFLAARAFREAQEGAEIINKRIEQIKADPDQFRYALRSAVVNYGNNEEMLKSIPHERVEDLAVYAKWDFGNGASAKLTDLALSYLGMTKEELLKAAKEGTAREMRFLGLDEVMRDIYREHLADEGLAEDVMAALPHSPFYVLSTKDRMDGAALIADKGILKGIHEKLGEDFYILPSSIHEILILPKSESPCPVEELKEMVSNINQQQVEPADRLSDNVYQFDGKKLSLAEPGGMEREAGISRTASHRHSR